MGKSSPAPPPAPDYAGAAKAQGAANLESAKATAKLSNPNIVGPLGGQTVTYGSGFDAPGYDQALADWRAGGMSGTRPDAEGYYTGDSLVPTVTQTLTPDAQATIESQQKVQKALADLGQQGIGTAQNALANPFDPNLPDVKTALNTTGYAQAPVNAGMTGQQAIMARLAPELDRQQKANYQQRVNQGIGGGSEAERNAMIAEDRSRNDLLASAAAQGLNLDMQANNQGFNQELAGTQFGNTALGQSLQQQLALRNQPLNEITGLMSGSQIQMPQFQGYQGASVAPPPIFGAAQAQGQADMQNFGIQSSNANASNAGAMGLMGTVAAGAMMMF